MLVSSISSAVTFLFGAVSGVIGTVLVLYCANCNGRRGKLDLTPPGPVYEDMSRSAPPAPLYQGVAAPPPATAAPYEDVLVPQLELKENVAYGQVETR